MRKLISLILILMMILSLCACSNSGDTSGKPVEIASGRGRYMESKVSLPLPDGAGEHSFVGMFASDEGMVFITSYGEGDATYWKNTYYRHTVTSEGVKTESVPWLDNAAPQGGNQLMLTCGGDALYFTFNDYDESGKPQNHLLVSRDGGKSGEALTGNGVSAMSMMISLAALSDGRIAVQDSDGSVVLLDSEGNISEEIGAASYGGSLASHENKLAYLKTSGKAVCVRDTASGEEVEWPIDIPEDSVAQMEFSRDGTLYLSCQAGLFSHSKDGTLWEKFVDGDSSNMGLPGYYITDIAIVEGEHATIYVTDYRADIYSYAFDPEAYQTASIELDVFSLDENSTVRQAVVAFNRSHSEVKVNYTVASSLAGGGTAQDYIKSLNTELIAGTGPDVIVLDGLPVDSYIEKGALADISAVISGAEKILPSVAKAYEKDGAAYAVPLGISLCAVLTRGTADAFTSMSALADAAEAASGAKLLSPAGYSYDTLPIMLLENYGDELYKGDAESVKAFLTDAMRIANAIGSTDKLGEGMGSLFGMTEAELDEFVRAEPFYPQIRDYVFNTADAVVFSLNSLASTDCMAAAEAVNAYGGAIYGIDGRFNAVGLAGINKASDNMDTANEFLKTLLSYDVQNADVLVSDSFPVNIAALDTLFAKENSNFSSGIVIDEEHELQGNWPTPQMRGVIRNILDGANTALTHKQELDSMLLEGISEYLSGASTLEQAAEKLNSVLSTYLSE